MLGYPPDTVWVRYEWDLGRVTRDPPEASAGLRFDDAEGGDRDEIAAVVIAAYRSDPTWAEMMPGIEIRMRSRVEETFGVPGSADAVARTSAGGIAGCSGVAIEHETEQNLLTGICVLPEHQRRGAGRRLLWESLRRLGALGVERPCVYTERGAVADRHVYPSFGSRREAGVTYPPD